MYHRRSAAGFDIVDYPEQARRLHRDNGEKGDLVDVAMIIFRQ